MGSMLTIALYLDERRKSKIPKITEQMQKNYGKPLLEIVADLKKNNKYDSSNGDG